MITLSEEQGMLLSTALDFCARKHLSRVFEARFRRAAFRCGSLASHGRFGLGGIIIPEQHGGLGMSLADACLWWNRWVVFSCHHRLLLRPWPLKH